MQLVPLQLQPLEMQQPPEIEIEHHQLEAQSRGCRSHSLNESALRRRQCRGRLVLSRWSRWRQSASCRRRRFWGARFWQLQIVSSLLGSRLTLDA